MPARRKADDENFVLINEELFGVSFYVVHSASKLQKLFGVADALRTAQIL